MPDEVDRAQENGDRLLNATIAAHRDKGHNSSEGEKDCLDCGEEIPEKRREAVPGCVRCLECQADHEENR